MLAEPARTAFEFAAQYLVSNDPALGYELLAEAMAADSGSLLHGTLDALAMISQRGEIVDAGGKV